jgi:hypothetical protein
MFKGSGNRMRRRRATAAALLLCTAGLCGCFTSSLVVTVRPDGSATVEQRTTVRPAAMIEFEKLASPGVASSAPDPAALAREIQQDLDETVRALRLRNLVRVRSEPVNTPDSTGWVLTYDVDDVTATALDLVPRLFGMSAGYGIPIAAKDRAAGTTTRVTATLEPVAGGLQRLTFHLPRCGLDPSAEPPAAWATGSAAEMAALKKLMAGSRVTVAVESAAPIVATNSPFRQDNRVTLLDADVEQALFSKQIGMMATTPATFQELLNAFADLPGVTLAREPDVWIEFENPSARPAALPLAPVSPATDTEIFLASLLDSNGELAVGAPVNITNNPGYDDQPSFSPDGREIVFASARRAVGSGSTGIPPTDIYRYEIASRTVWRVTNTPEAEFSPAVMPDGKHLSLVRVERDGTQRLWRIPNDSSEKGETAVVFRDLKPVGYYAWMNDRTAAVYVPGERGQAATLQVADVVSGSAQKIASDIGRSIQRMPSGSISYVQHESGTGDRGAVTIRRLFNTEPGRFTTELIVRPPAAASDPPITWLPDGTLLTAINDILYHWRPQRNTWKPIAFLGNFGLHDVSRIAASPKGDRLAIVASAR